MSHNAKWCLGLSFHSIQRLTLHFTVKPVQSDHPLVQIKAVFVGRLSLFAASIHWSNAKLTMKEVIGKKKKAKDQKHRSKHARAEVGFSVWALLGLPSNFCRGTSQKEGVSYRHTVALRTEIRPTEHEKPGRWSRKAGGRYSQCGFCMKLSVHEKAVNGSRSLFHGGR